MSTKTNNLYSNAFNIIIFAVLLGVCLVGTIVDAGKIFNIYHSNQFSFTKAEAAYSNCGLSKYSNFSKTEYSFIVNGKVITNIEHRCNIMVYKNSVIDIYYNKNNPKESGMIFERIRSIFLNTIVCWMLFITLMAFIKERGADKPINKDEI